MLRWGPAPGVALLVATALLAGCIGDVTPPVQILWEASLTGTEAQPGVTGSAAAISRTRTTEAGIHVEGFAAGTYTWEIRDGGCAQPGDVIGSAAQYPDLAIPVEGEASVDAVVLSERMQPDRSYLVAVRVADTSDIVACGDFVEWG